MITQGSYTAVTGDPFYAAAFWLGVCPGVLITAVLSANNLEDITDDDAAGLRTIAVRLGFARARLLYAGTLALLVPAELSLWFTGLFDAWILLPLITLPVLILRIREALSAAGPGDGRLAELTARTGKLHALFCLTLCLAVALARGL